MVSLDVALRALAALTSCVFAFIAISAGWRRPTHQYFGAFLLLVAGNHVAEAFSAASTPGSATQLVWLATAFACAALDPLFLYVAATARPDGTTRRRKETLVVFASTLTIVALTPFAFAQYDALVIGRAQSLLGILTAILYLVTLRRFLVRMSPGGPLPKGSGALLAALFIIVLPALTRAADQTIGLATWLLGAPELRATILEHAGAGIHLGLVGAFVLLARVGLPARARDAVTGPAIRRALVLAGVVLALIDLRLINANLAAWGLMSNHEVLGIFGRTGAALRWILVGALLSSAVLRHQLLGISLTARRYASRVLVALAFLEAGVLAVLAIDIFRLGTSTLDEPLTLTLLFVALILSQGFRSLVDQVAERVFGVPSAGDIVAIHATYRRSVESLGGNRPPERGTDELKQLRIELGIDETVAAAIERAVGEQDQGPLVAGRVIVNRYRVCELVREGPHQVTAIAEDTLLGRPVVIDQFPLIGDVDRFFARVRAYGNLQRAQLAPVEDFVVGEHEAHIVLGDVECESLRSWNERRPKPSIIERRRAARDLLDAVAILHEAGYTHGRLTFDAFVVRPNGSVVLRDPAFTGPPASAHKDVADVRRLVDALVIEPLSESPQPETRNLRPVTPDDLSRDSPT